MKMMPKRSGARKTWVEPEIENADFFELEEKEETSMANVMTIASLTRVSAEVELPKTDIANLAKEAARLLGYSVLLKEVHKPLLEVLSKLEIDILDVAKVEKYQAQVLKKANGVNIDDEEDSDEYCYWEKVWIEGYSAPIPEFVLAKAVEIKKAEPNARFQVEYMQTVTDPFLIVCMNHESYYLEVWDEPKFEGRITKAKKKKI